MSKRSFFSNPCSADNTLLLKEAVIHRLGDSAYGSREYVLVPADVSIKTIEKDPKLKLASVHAHQNVIFGARVIRQNAGSMAEVCDSLVDAALQDASSQGEQPQGMATLYGLCEWVTKGINGEKDIQVLETMKKTDPQTYEAVVAMATGVPREGHSVVGMGTFRDAQFGWEELAKEFVGRNLGEEAALYQSKGGELVTIEHMADKSDAYIKSAGGAMARFFFL